MNLSLINLFLAIIWLALAAFLFILSQTGNPKTVFGLPFEAIALVFGLYNLVRWWSTRAAAAQRRRDEEAPRKPSLRRASDNQTAPDPNFIFTDPPQGGDGITPEKK